MVLVWAASYVVSINCPEVDSSEMSTLKLGDKELPRWSLKQLQSINPKALANRGRDLGIRKRAL